MLYRIIRRDGKPLADLQGEPIVFATRVEAERWLMLGEWVEPVKRPK